MKRALRVNLCESGRALGDDSQRSVRGKGPIRANLLRKVMPIEKLHDTKVHAAWVYTEVKNLDDVLVSHAASGNGFLAESRERVRVLRDGGREYLYRDAFMKALIVCRKDCPISTDTQLHSQAITPVEKPSFARGRPGSAGWDALSTD